MSSYYSRPAPVPSSSYRPAPVAYGTASGTSSSSASTRPAPVAYGSSASTSASASARDTGTTAIRHLTSVQLQAVLRSRGVRIPPQPQAHSWYLSQCATIRLTEVPNSELRSIDGGGSQQQPAAYQQQQQQPYRSNAAATAQPRELRLELGVVELSLTAEAMRSSGQRPRSVRVRIEPPPGVDEGTSSGVLETNALATGSSAAPQLRFDSSHEILLERGGRAWSALQRALEGPKPGSDLYFGRRRLQQRRDDWRGLASVRR